MAADVPSRGAEIRRRMLRDRRATLGLAVLALLFLLAFAGPYASKWAWTSTDFGALREPPSAEHWFGTTQSGRDVYALTLRGLQKSLIIGICVALLSTGMAALVGMAAGYLGGWADRALMWGVDLLLVLPAFLVLAILTPVFRKAWLLLVLLLASLLWMVTARVVRATTMSLKEREYVLAARYLGVSTPRVIVRHILPNLASLLIIDATVNVSTAIITESGLSYFGFGVQPPDGSLGTVIADGAPAATTFPWLFGFGAGLLVLAVLAVNLVGDGLRDALDPAPRGGR